VKMNRWVIALWATCCWAKLYAEGMLLLPQWGEELGVVDSRVSQHLQAHRYQEAAWALIQTDPKMGQEKAAKVLSFLDRVMMESFVEAKDIKNLGGGATETKLVSLDFGVRGVFKPMSSHPSSDYKAEVAAYKIDQLGAFNLVPKTEMRRISGKIGSLQYFMTNAKVVSENYKKSANLEVFDYITRNKDRNAGNIMRTDEFEVAIDHGLSLKPSSAMGGFLRAVDFLREVTGKHTLRQTHIYPKDHPEAFIPSPAVVARLRAWTLEELQRELMPILDEEQVQMVFDKTQKFLKAYDKHQQGLIVHHDF
jgi:hypothetical protein